MDARDELIFMEDIEEKPYRIDRMLTQLRQSAHLHQAAGFAFRILCRLWSRGRRRFTDFKKTIIDNSADHVPAVYGLSFGHISHQCTLPIGVMAELDTEQRR